MFIRKRTFTSELWSGKQRSLINPSYKKGLFHTKQTFFVHHIILSFIFNGMVINNLQQVFINFMEAALACFFHFHYQDSIVWIFYTYRQLLFYFPFSIILLRSCHKHSSCLGINRYLI